jgi:hypothetical protein
MATGASASSPAAAVLGVSRSTLATSRRHQVVIWQAAGGVGHDLAFMYRPVMDTLVAGFTHLPAAVSAAIGTLNVVSGSGVAAKSPEYKKMMRLARDLGPRDLFLFIGPIGSESVPWDAMRDRGVRTVYYQTEPVNGCALSKARPDEVWDFSWHNLDACKPYPKPWLTQPFQMRYVPMGYIKPPAEARVRGYVPPDDAPELFFFGYPFYKSGRKRCYERLQRALGARLNATWMLWSPMAFERWWRASGRWAAHLNLHKACESARNPVVFRTSILLSRGATVISERANHKDEREYAGLVHFGAVDEIPHLLNRLWIAPQPATPFGARRVRSVQLRPELASVYAERFAPQRIFERAGVYAALIGHANASRSVAAQEQLGLQLGFGRSSTALATALVGAAAAAAAAATDDAILLGRRINHYPAAAAASRANAVEAVETDGRPDGRRDVAAGRRRSGRGARLGRRGSGGGGSRRGGERGDSVGADSGVDSGAHYALLLHGRLGTIGVAPSISLVMQASLLKDDDFARAIGTCAASHLEHIVQANGRPTEGGGVDVFVHTWNPDLGWLVDAQYAPHLRASLHEPVEFVEKEKARSQALSIGRAAALMRAHESARRRPYSFCLVLRADLLVGAPIMFKSCEWDRLWFTEHCCMNEANTDELRARVRAQCTGESDPQITWHKRVLGQCRASQYGGQWGLEKKPDDFYYFLMDWWFAARPAVVATWVEISSQWEWYKERMRRMLIWRYFSHYIWAFHVHDVLNRTVDVRFRAGVRVNLIRNAYPRLHFRAGRLVPLGEYVTDATGKCATMVTLANVSIDSDGLLRMPVDPPSPFGAGYAPRFLPMAEQCASARLAEPIICCGAPPRRCGTHVCSPSYADANRRFLQAGEAYGRAVRKGLVARPLLGSTSMN